MTIWEILTSFFRLLDTLEVYLDQYTTKKLPLGIDRFPDSITVGQAVSTWKEIVKYQNRYETEIR